MSKPPYMGLSAALWREIANRLLTGPENPEQVRRGLSKAVLARELAAADPAFKAKVKAEAARIRTEQANQKLHRQGFSVAKAQSSEHAEVFRLVHEMEQAEIAAAREASNAS